MHVDVGMARLEIAEARQQPFGGEGGRHADGQPPDLGLRLGLADGGGELGEALANARQAGLARRRQHEHAAFAPEQAHPHEILELADLLADGGRGHQQLRGSLGEAAATGRDLEAAQRIQGRQLAQRQRRLGARAGSVMLGSAMVRGSRRRAKDE